MQHRFSVHATDSGWWGIGRWQCWTACCLWSGSTVGHSYVCSAKANAIRTNAPKNLSFDGRHVPSCPQLRLLHHKVLNVRNLQKLLLNKYLPKLCNVWGISHDTCEVLINLWNVWCVSIASTCLRRWHRFEMFEVLAWLWIVWGVGKALKGLMC